MEAEALVLTIAEMLAEVKVKSLRNALAKEEDKALVKKLDDRL